MQAVVRRSLSALVLLLVSSSIVAATPPRSGASQAPHVDVENVSGRPDADVTLRARVVRPGSGPRADSVSFYVGGMPAGNVTTSLDGLATTPFRIPGGQSLGTTPIEARVAGDPSLPGFTGDGTLTVLARPMAVMTAIGQAVKVTVTSVSAMFGDHIKLEATVMKVPQNQPAQDGHIDFKIDGNDVLCGYITTDGSGKVSCGYTVGTAGPIKAGANELTASFVNWPAIQPSLDYLPATGKGTVTVSRSDVKLFLTAFPQSLDQPHNMCLHPESRDHLDSGITLPIRIFKNGVFLQDFFTKLPGPDGLHFINQPGSYQVVFDGNDWYAPAKSNVVTVQ